MITIGIKDFLSRKLRGENISIVGMYSEYGTDIDFPEGTGPFFTVQESDTIDDISDDKIFVPVYSISGTNVLDIMCFINDMDDKIHYGFNLIAKQNDEEILIARNSGIGIKKRPGVKIGIFWGINL